MRHDSAVRASWKFLRVVASEQRDVVAVEKGFKFTMPGPVGKEPLTIAGRFDRIERTAEGIRIIDYKSTGPRSQQDG